MQFMESACCYGTRYLGDSPTWDTRHDVGVQDENVIQLVDWPDVYEMFGSSLCGSESGSMLLDPEVLCGRDHLGVFLNWDFMGRNY